MSSIKRRLLRLALFQLMFNFRIHGHYHRELYETQRYGVNVSTAAILTFVPTDATMGMYNNVYGLFVSSSAGNSIYFMDTSTGCADNLNCKLIRVSGTGAFGGGPGYLDRYPYATFANPTRIAFVDQVNSLYVLDRAVGNVRQVSFTTNYVGILATPSGSIKISSQYNGNPLSSIVSCGEYIYYHDEKSLYNLTGYDYTLATTNVSVRYWSYKLLQQWYTNYFKSSTATIILSSMTVQQSTSTLFVFYSYARNVIISFPVTLGSLKEIKVFLPDNGKTYSSIPFVNPPSLNGPINTGSLAFVSASSYNPVDQTIYWTDSYLYSSGNGIVNLLGTNAVRRYQTISKTVDYYAGSSSVGKSSLFSTGGFLDGPAPVALFNTPMGLAYFEQRAGGACYFIIDSANSAIRFVKAYDKYGPSVAPTPSPLIIPSSLPTVQPTTTSIPSIVPSASPTTNPTFFPSSIPTVSPSAKTPSPSKSPTSSPTTYPTLLPSNMPVSTSATPTKYPTVFPTSQPTVFPTSTPVHNPTFLPTDHPTFNPSIQPTVFPTSNPSVQPTVFPTSNPSVHPTVHPSVSPIASTPKPVTSAPSSVPSSSYPTVNSTVASSCLL